jgi:hypothetical protein
MADLQFQHVETGVTLYAVIERLSDNYIWDTTGTPAFEAYAAAGSWGDYDIALLETPAGSYRYTFTFPAGITAPGDYIVKVFRRAGASPAASDPLVGAAVASWTGSALMQLGNVDSTGTPLTAAKALEVAVAILTGKASYDTDTGQWSVKGRNGATTIATITLTGGGNRSAVSIP